MGHQVITLEFGISAIWEDETLGEGAEARSKIPSSINGFSDQRSHPMGALMAVRFLRMPVTSTQRLAPVLLHPCLVGTPTAFLRALRNQSRERRRAASRVGTS